MKTMLSALACVIAFSFTAPASAGTITIQGSDTLLEMVTAEAASYSKQNSGTSVQVTGGGSGTGIAAILNGTVDIADASRPMKKKERKKVTKKGGTVFELAIALDGISLYINPSNKVSNLSMAQLKDIYTGKVNNWKEVGGADAKIIRYSRENSSGTYAFLKEHVLKKENYAADCQALPGTASVVNAVSKDKNGIGYGGLSYAEGVKLVNIDGVAPSVATVASGAYPVSRKLFQYTINKPTGAVQAFMLYELSKEGQALAIKAGYVPLPEKMRLASIAQVK